MQTNNNNEVNIKIINTQSPSFIKANINKLIYMLYGINPIGNKYFQISYNDVGGFNCIKTDRTNANFSGNVIKGKEDATKKVTEFLKQKNELMTRNFKNENITFFPISYMKPVATIPNYVDGKNGSILQSWSVIYKITIPAYTNKDNQQEKVDILNADIAITMSTNGQIVRVNYSLLPLQDIKSSTLNKVVAEEDTIPQIIYLLNKDIQNITPFYLSVTETAYIPATNDSIVPKQTISQPDIPFINPMEYDENRVVMWLRTSNTSKVLLAKDATDEEKKKNAANTLPIGAKVIRLQPKSETSETTPCLYFWNDKYNVTDIPERNLSNKFLTSFYSR